MVGERGEHFEGLTYPLHLEPLNPTMDKKLVINVAVTGAFLKREQNPYQAYTAEEVASQAIEAYKAGAAMWHVHIRDKEGYPILGKDPVPIKETVDMVLDECPDVVIQHSGHADMTKRGSAGLMPLVEAMVKASTPERKYIDTMVIVPRRTATMEMNQGILVDIVNYLQDFGVKPEFQLYDYMCIDNVIRWLIQPGILHQPYIMNILSGGHGHQFVGPTQPEPWGYVHLMTLMQQMPRGSVIGATIGGRNWLPLTVFAIMLGVDVVRIGMEDAIWMYPHKDEKISKCADVIRKVAAVAEELGREIATPAETRHILALG